METTEPEYVVTNTTQISTVEGPSNPVAVSPPVAVTPPVAVLPSAEEVGLPEILDHAGKERCKAFLVQGGEYVTLARWVVYNMFNPENPGASLPNISKHINEVLTTSDASECVQVAIEWAGDRMDYERLDQTDYSKRLELLVSLCEEWKPNELPAPVRATAVSFAISLRQFNNIHLIGDGSFAQAIVTRPEWVKYFLKRDDNAI